MDDGGRSWTRDPCSVAPIAAFASGKTAKAGGVSERDTLVGSFLAAADRYVKSCVSEES